MTATTMKSFAQSTGQSANKKSGKLTGALLGKLADGLEAMEAIKVLALGHANRFMDLAMQAVHVTKQKLEAVATKPYASQDVEFNAALNPAARGRGPKGPGLGGASSAAKRKRQEE